MVDPVERPSRLVATGYDAAAERYARWGRARAGSDPRRRFVDTALGLAAYDALVLDLGCGTGEHATASLASRYRVIGVDISLKSVTLAQAAVPHASFVIADMATVAFAPGSFELVTAFYSLIHVPRRHHRRLLRNVQRWLRPGGHLIATMGTTEWEGTEDHWHGAPKMFWSHWGTEHNMQLVKEAGFSIVAADELLTDEDGRQVGFLWVIAQRP